jgi:4-carboxymuconolactone decarboxylase
VIACHWDADYVRQAHIREGRAAGLAEQAIQDIIAGRDPKLADPHEDAVFKVRCGARERRKNVGRGICKIEKALGRAGVAEVLVLLGYYTSVALAMKVHDLPVVKA